MAAGLPRIGITMGDPAGIGPEIILKALSDERLRAVCTPLVIGDLGLLESARQAAGTALRLRPISSPVEAPAGEEIGVISLTALEGIKPGVLSSEGGRASGLYIEKGVELALKGEIDAVVTAPINKASFNSGGFHYPGHTEFLAHLTATSNYAMMLMGVRLRVVLLTIHCPLMEVGGRLSTADTLRILRLTHTSLRDDFGIEAPRLALAGLNPHAGEGGLFGREDLEILLPAARRAREEGINVTDPLPSDTLFFSAVRGGYDAVVCPYHDQGLIPLKMLHFEDGVNVTLGLPVIRTSPDHGTAYDIAGKGIAGAESMKAAIRTAVAMAEARNEKERKR